MGTFTVAEITGGPVLPAWDAVNMDGLTPHTRDYLRQAYDALKAGKRVLIVGSKASNFEDRLRLDDRFEFWDSTDPATATRPLPVRVGAMLFLKFINHRLYERLCTEAARLGFKPLPLIQSSGQARKLLHTLVRLAPAGANGTPVPPVQVADPSIETILGSLTPTPTPATPVAARRGHPQTEASLTKRAASKDLWRWIANHSRLPIHVHLGEIEAEAARLLPEAQEQFPRLTLKNLSSAISAMRLRAGLPKVRRSKRQEAEPRKSPAVRIAEAVEAFVQEPPAPQAVQGPAPEVPQELGLADGFEMLVRACSLFMDAAPLVAEQLKTMQAEMDRLRAERDDYKDRFDSMIEAATRPPKTGR